MVNFWDKLGKSFLVAFAFCVKNEDAVFVGVVTMICLVLFFCIPEWLSEYETCKNQEKFSDNVTRNNSSNTEINQSANKENNEVHPDGFC